MGLLLRLAGAEMATDRIRVMTFEAADGSDLPEWSAGAHVDFDLGTLGTRSYSLIDWPKGRNTAHYVVAVQREEPGEGGSAAMHKLAVGDTIPAEAPKNDFELRDHPGPALLLAGGIGVTPMISMATALQAAGREYRFIYAGRTASAMAFREDIPAAFVEAVAFHMDDGDSLDLVALMQTLTPDTHLYICGPRGMIDAAREAAVAAGHAGDQIHIELFTSSAEAKGDSAFEVEMASTGDVYTIPPGKSIIDVLEDAGHDLIYDCQRGDCGICQTDVISGEPDHRDVVLSDAEKASGKLMQICVSRAKSARLVLDL